MDLSLFTFFLPRDCTQCQYNLPVWFVRVTKNKIKFPLSVNRNVWNFWPGFLYVFVPVVSHRLGYVPKLQTILSRSQNPHKRLFQQSSAIFAHFRLICSVRMIAYIFQTTRIPTSQTISVTASVNGFLLIENREFNIPETCDSSVTSFIDNWRRILQSYAPPCVVCCMWKQMKYKIWNLSQEIVEEQWYPIA